MGTVGFSGVKFVFVDVFCRPIVPGLICDFFHRILPSRLGASGRVHGNDLQWTGASAGVEVSGEADWINVGPFLYQRCGEARGERHFQPNVSSAQSSSFVRECSCYVCVSWNVDDVTFFQAQ